MKKENPEDIVSSYKMGGVRKFFAVFAIMLIGALAILLVMKIIPRATFGDFLIKSFASWLIALAMTGAITLLLRSK